MRVKNFSVEDSAQVCFAQHYTPCKWSRLAVGWQALMDKRIGIIPLPMYGVMLICLGIFMVSGSLFNDISVMIATLAVAGFACAELGARIPGLGKLGGPVIVTALLPSCLVYYQWLPLHLTQAIGDFWQSTNIVYLFIASITVGSILSMERQVLIRGCIKIFLPLAVSSVIAASVGTLTGMVLGLSAYHTFFYIVVPIMAGGVGEGVIPLTLGYSEILQVPQGPLLAEVMPAVMFGNLAAIVCASLLKQLGKRHAHLTGQGHLQPASSHWAKQASAPPGIEQITAAGITAVSLYLLGMLVHKLIGLPAPVMMLFGAVLLRLSGAVSSKLQDGAGALHHFFSSAFTYPLLFAMGITVVPWQALLTALNLANFITIMVTVFTLTIAGFFAGRWVGLYPIEGAIVTACHSGMGGIGDVAVLTAANRMQLMPFAQISTRIGGAITITLALTLLHQLVSGG